MKEKIGDFIKRTRTELGYSSEELARLSGYTGVQIRNFEQGKHKPTVNKLNGLAKALNCSYEDLYEMLED